MNADWKGPTPHNWITQRLHRGSIEKARRASPIWYLLVFLGLTRILLGPLRTGTGRLKISARFSIGTRPLQSQISCKERYGMGFISAPVA